MNSRIGWPWRARTYCGGAALAALLTVGLAIALHRRPPTHPSAAQITGVMFQTVLVQDPFEHFYPAGQLTTTSDGSGGDLTAEVGAIQPTTDGDGQLVFFWHDNRFVGWDSPLDSMDILELQRAGTSQFWVTYSNYATNDGACCPSLIPVSVLYRWTGDRFVANAPAPGVRPIPDRVHLIR